ncbi:hypothetical protein AU509_07370 [Lonsdalea britannica]|uniref:Uncharacterized protein n=1 Tax=Lonsdalea britannica TaxID=1082704 RepID=A0AAD0WLE7_9GAMM|nr:hypothetical protein [Lonsdalea britannica]AXW87787.1 hypothetical protein CKQ53_12950 [Lonsdalea britannica]OSM98333.1 hypothetical protein AU509_07370 [Lonsdalea britannica]
MSESEELSLIEISKEQAPALYVPNGLDPFLEQIRSQVNEVPDLTTAKGRQRIASLAAKVSRSKTAVEKPGRDYLRHLKEAVKPAEAELRRWVTKCDELRDEIRRPLSEWEAEQERIKAEEQMLAWHEEALEMNEAHEKAALERFELDHEIALLLNDKFDRDAAEAKAEEERKRKEQEEELKRLAVEKAQLEAAQEAQRERDAAAAREAALKAQAEQAEREAKEAAARAEQQRIEAEQRAEREKQEAITEERQRAEQAEATRLAEEKRIADEAEKRAANEAHRKAVGTDVVKGLLEHAGLTREQAIATLKALMSNSIPHVTINY